MKHIEEFVLLGLLKCNEDGEQTCIGFIKPEIEICDDKDNDCDGVIDNGYLYLSVEDPNNDCNGVYCGRCYLANKICSKGIWQCVPVLKPQPETCNSLDDDCNCEIDNGIETTFYYPEQDYPHTVGIGECRPGIKTCYDGVNTDISPIIPQDEVCDGLDNNCNGFIDDDNSTDPKAFFIVLDISGSMSDKIDIIKQTICAFAQTNISNNSLFAIIEVSIGYSAPYVFLAQDFSSSQQTCDLMNIPGFGGPTNIGTEYMLQGVLLTSTIIWPLNMDRKIVMFTDEEKQLYFNTDEINVLSQCQEQTYEIGIYSLSSLLSQWDTLVNTCGGYEDVLTNDVQEMKQSLITHYFGICQ